MEIPYRVDTPEAITEMKNLALPGIGRVYRTMLSVAGRFRPEIPPAMARARPVVAKAFAIPAGDIFVQHEIVREAPRDIGDIRVFERIEDQIAWVGDVARFENMRDFLLTCPAAVQEACLVDSVPATPSRMLMSGLAIRKFLRLEIVRYSRSKRTKHLGREQFRKCLAAHALFDPRNEDVLRLLQPSGCGETPRLRKNALAEFYFARLPASLEELVIIDPKIIRRKLFAKVAALPVRGVHKSNLYGQFPVSLRQEDLVPTLQRIERLFGRLNVPGDTKRLFHDYVRSLTESVLRARQVYRELFIDKSMEQLQRIYRPRRPARPAAGRIVVHAPISTEILELYPTKDYLDLYRGRISKDCVDTILGEAQLKVPNFFNLRIFRDTIWIGNIYMLDFTASHGVLLVDRIQIPRSFKAEYLNFFEDLGEALSLLFADVDYQAILTTVAISNNPEIQALYNRYRKKLAKRAFSHGLRNLDCFESLKARSYYILHSKNGPLELPLART